MFYFVCLFSSSSVVLTESRTLLFLTLPHQGGWRWKRIREGTQPGKMIQTDPRNIPYHTMTCLGVRAGGQKKNSELWCLSSKVSTTSDVDLIPSKWLSTCQWEVVNDFFIVLCLPTIFVLPIKLPFSQPMSFLTLLFWFSSLAAGEWASGCVGLSYLPRLNHNTKIQELNFSVRWGFFVCFLKKEFLKSLWSFTDHNLQNRFKN